MSLEELVTTRNKYQRKLEDKNAYRELCETVGKNNATANREWLRILNGLQVVRCEKTNN